MFDGANLMIGAGQPEYQTLPAKALPGGVVLTAWQLDPQDLDFLAKEADRRYRVAQVTGDLPDGPPPLTVWLAISTFGQPLQPVLMQLQPPTHEDVVTADDVVTP